MGVNTGCRAPEVTERKVDGVMALSTDKEVDVWRAVQPVDVDVPADSTKDGQSRRGETGEVGHGRAGDESDVRGQGEAEQLEQPLPATSSIATTAGVAKRSPAFWSQALTSQSDASATGNVPPMTQPKNRPD